MGHVARHAIVTVVALVVLPGAASLPSSAEGSTPPPHRRVDVIELASTTDRQWAPWVDSRSGRPYRVIDPHLAVTVDPVVVEHVGLQAILEGLQAFNDIPGSAVHVDVDLGPASDAAWRLTMRDCADLGEHEGRTRLAVASMDRFGAWVDGATMEVCPTVRERSHHFIRHLLAHELAHVLGLGHVCNEPECWPSDDRVDPCEFMSPSVHPCQDLDQLRPVLKSLYPAASRPSPPPGSTPLDRQPPCIRGRPLLHYLACPT